MSGEPTEMAGAAEANTESAYAWGVDYDDPDEFPTVPVRLTSRRITALAIAASLIVIAAAGALSARPPTACGMCRSCSDRCWTRASPTCGTHWISCRRVHWWWWTHSSSRPHRDLRPASKSGSRSRCGR